jgi:hypothetical protein
MTFELGIGPEKKLRLDYSWNWFFGTERLFADGRLIESRSAASPLTPFGTRRKRRCAFTVGAPEAPQVVLERQRPLLFAGLRPHAYRLFVDGTLVHEPSGY